MIAGSCPRLAVASYSLVSIFLVYQNYSSDARMYFSTFGPIRLIKPEHLRLSPQSPEDQIFGGYQGATGRTVSRSSLWKVDLLNLIPGKNSPVTRTVAPHPWEGHRRACR